MITIKKTKHIKTHTALLLNRVKSYLVLLLLFISGVGFSQVSSSIDTTTIKIGEEIMYSIQVEADSTAQVLFPEGQTFNPLEVIESYKTDTTFSQAKITLIKKYGLTQFDSGHYTIPSQRVVINNKPYNTDSVLVEVQDVLVDTTKQKMFDIKPFIETPKPPIDFTKWLYWILPVIALLGIIIFLLLRRKRKQAEAKLQLPPYEEALTALKELDNSTLLQEQKAKEYYSALTEIVKRYLDKEVDDRALESTTNELVQRLKLHKEAGHFDFNTTTLKKLEAVLKRADLVKFAKLQEDQGQAIADRSVVEEVITETKEAIPEPTEEELLQNQQYLEEQRQKKRSKRIKIALISGVLLLLISIGTAIAVWGVQGIKDIITGNTSKALLEKQWIKSEYGSPAIIIESPEVLVRRDIKQAGENAPQAQVFQYGNIFDKFWITVSTVSLPEGTQIDLSQALEQGLQTLESFGALNMVVKQEEFKTEKGIEGLKGYGEFNLKNKKGKILDTPLKYETLLFKQEGGLQNILIVYKKDDPNAERIKTRIINSVELEITKTKQQ